MFTASRLLTDEGYGKRKDQVVKWKKWEGRSNDDRPVGSTTVLENLTIRLMRDEREFAFSGDQADGFDGIPGFIRSSFCLFLLSLALSDSDRKATIDQAL
ncbi:hypothetical protein ALC57_03553 [Trachymyrmex cornetzi]|uniref:Uncharacterized protein n=1 Tax=Trachymyrmex cornetzi TaxID=471704 RepID=A0A195EH69_9HYME|nr:hypothetical protein ALC57_03553 [Trachymyrmex cornetzi]